MTWLMQWFAVSYLVFTFRLREGGSFVRSVPRVAFVFGVCVLFTSCGGKCVEVYMYAGHCPTPKKAENYNLNIYSSFFRL